MYSRLFSPLRVALASPQPRSHSPVQDNRSIPIDDTIPRRDNGQYQPKPQAQAQTPSTLSLLRHSVLTTTVQASPTSLTARFPHGFPTTAYSPKTGTADFEPDDSKKQKRQLKEHNERRWTAGEAEQGDYQYVLAASSEQVNSHSPPPPPVSPATRTLVPRETMTPISTLTVPYRKGGRRETESSTITSPLNAEPDDFLPAQERERYRPRQQSMRRTSILPRDRGELVGGRPGPSAIIGSAHVEPLATKVQVLDDLANPPPFRTSSFENASTASSLPLPRSYYNRDDRDYTRRGSRSTPVDVNIPCHDEPLGSGGGTDGGMRSVGPSSAIMHTDERERYYQNRPPKPAAYLARNQHYPSHREPRYTAQDREIPRPPPPRMFYGTDDRDYAPPASAPLLRPPPRSPYNDDREYTLACRPPSSRPYEDRDHHTPQPTVHSPVRPRSSYDACGLLSHYAYDPSQRSGGYRTPPASSYRYGSHEYQPTNELCDTRDPGLPFRGYGYRDYSPPSPPSCSAPPEEYDYECLRQESARAMPPTRQATYSRREPGDRQMEDLDSYQFEHGAWKKEREQVFYNHEDREHAPIHSLPASYPSPSRLYEAQDYYIPPSAVRSSVPLRPPYDGNYDRPHAPPIARQVHDPNPYAAVTPSHAGSHPTLSPSHVYNYRKHPSPSMSADEDTYEYQRPDSARPPTNDDSEKPEPARRSKQLHFAHEGTHLDVEEQDRHKEEEWRRKTHDMRVKEEEVRRKEDEIARREEDARQKEWEAQRKAEEGRLEKEEAQIKAEEARRMGEEAQRKAEEAQVKEQEAQRKEAKALRMQEELTRRDYEAHAPRRPYSFPPAMLSNRQVSYPWSSHFRNPLPAKRGITTSSARNKKDVALRSDKEFSHMVPIDTHAHLLEVAAASNSKFEMKSLNQPKVENHPGEVMDMGASKAESSSAAVSNMASERNQFLAGAQRTTIHGGTFATVAGDMIINTAERSDAQGSEASDDEDADAQSKGYSSRHTSPFNGRGLAIADAEVQWTASMEWHGTEEENQGTKILVEEVADYDEDTDKFGESLPVDVQPNADNAYHHSFLFKF